MNAPEKEDALTLQILEAIEAQSDVTQRSLARRMNVALGLANSYLRRCVRKGLVKIQQVPANRYLYYLTAKGFAEKSRLTTEYLSHSFDFYRRAGESYARAFAHCRQQRWRRVLLCGVSELAEIASLRALEHGVKVSGVFDPGCGRDRFLNKQVTRRLDACAPFDAALLTALNEPQQWYQRLVRSLPPDRIVVPDILGLRVPD